MEWIYAMGALLVGGLLGWLISERRRAAAVQQTRDELAEAIRKYTEEIARLQAQIDNKEGLLQEVRQALEGRENEWRQQIQENTRLATEAGVLNTTVTNLRDKLEQQMKEVKEQEQRLRAEFTVLANEILRKNSLDLSQLNKDQISVIIHPLKEQIERFEKRVNDLDTQGAERHGQLRQELDRLRELNTSLQEEATNLTRALKGDSKSQGNWGEMILEKVLEVSGLEEGREYRKQGSVTGTDQSRLRPDVIVNLPDNKHIIIDAKVSLTAYEQYANADTDIDRKNYIQQHIASVRNHIKLLSDKQYQASDLIDSPDFVLMFMPLEPAFSLSMKEKPELFNEAWERKIVIVSPTTLLATLRTVASIWKHEKQTQNALEIAKVGGGLYDKFVLLLDDLQRIGNQLDTARRTYDDTLNKLSSGKGNLIRRVQVLKELGARVSKNIPAHLLDRDESILLSEDEAGTE